MQGCTKWRESGGELMYPRINSVPTLVRRLKEAVPFHHATWVEPETAISLIVDHFALLGCSNMYP